MRPSARFHEACKEFKDRLSKSKLANISEVSIGRKVIATRDDDDCGEEYRGEVCFIDVTTKKVYLKEITCDTDVGEVEGSGVTSQKKGEPGNIIQDSGDVYIEREEGSIDQLYEFELELVRTDPQWISELIKSNRPYKLPIFINTYVFEAIVAHLSSYHK